MSPDGRAPRFHQAAAGYTGAIPPDQERVRLGFEWGARLPDPDRALTGATRQVRYVEAPALGTVPEQSSRRLLLDAVAPRSD